MWYKVTYENGVHVNELGSCPALQTDLIYASHYRTQATNGAGMVADFYMEPNGEPTDTFSKVVKVSRSQPCDTARADLTIEDANYILRQLRLHEPEHSMAIQTIISKAITSSWSSIPPLSETKQTARGRS